MSAEAHNAAIAQRIAQLKDRLNTGTWIDGQPLGPERTQHAVAELRMYGVEASLVSSCIKTPLTSGGNSNQTLRTPDQLVRRGEGVW